MPASDRILKSAVLPAPLARAWAAIGDARAFGAWFGLELDGPFAPGARLTGRIRPTTVDPDVARLQEPHAGTAFSLDVVRVEPPSLLSFRWHPYSVEPGADLSGEPTTLVELRLSAAPGGTALEICESGFDALPAARRAAAYAANEGGWEHQLRLVAQYLERQSSPASG